MRRYLLQTCSLACLTMLPPSVVLAAGYRYDYTPTTNSWLLQPRVEVGMKPGTDRSLMMTEFWMPLAQERDRVLYGDMRLMGDDSDNWEGNLGVGYRQIVPELDTVLGVHGWIDRRRTESDATVYQATLGVESLGKAFDIRANGYVPLSDAKHTVTANIGSANPYLAGTGLYYDTNGVITETPQYGFDAEVGYRIPAFEKQVDALRVYGGGYGFWRDETENVIGGRIRVEAQVNGAVAIGTRLQYDEERGSQAFLEATLKFPFSAKKLYRRDKLRARLDESPERDVDIVTAAKVDTGLRKSALNVASGQDQRVIHVDNSNTAGGDGSKENPFNSLAGAQAALQANDVIYVHGGTGTTLNMDKGFIIDKAGVSLIGSGSNFFWDSGKFMSSTGDRPVPQNGYLIAAASAAPVITNTQVPVDALDYYTGHGVLVTENNAYITGITVNGAASAGIHVIAENGAQWQNITIDNVHSINNTGPGIRIYSVDGAHIENISVINSTANGSITSNGILCSTVRSVGQPSGSAGTILVNNNTTSDNFFYGTQIAVSGTSVEKVILTNNTSDDNLTRAGISLQVTGAGHVEDAFISNNHTSGNLGTSGRGIIAQTDATASISNLTIDHNTVSGNDNRGIAVSNVGHMDVVNVNDNILSGNGSTGIDMTGGGTWNTVTIDNNTSNGNSGNGINVGISGTMTDLTISNNIANTNDNGISVSASAGGNIQSALIQSNDTFFNTTNGLSAVAGTTTSSGTINQIEINDLETKNNTGNGLYIAAQSGGIVGMLTMNAIHSYDNGQRGIYLNTSAGQITQSYLRNSTLTGNGNSLGSSTSYGLYIVSGAAATGAQTMLIENSVFTGNYYEGIRINNDSAYAMTVDAGGGTLGSIGYNSIYGNGIANTATYKDIMLDLNGGQLAAQHNWWGQAGGMNASQKVNESGSQTGTIDNSNWLTNHP